MKYFQQVLGPYQKVLCLVTSYILLSFILLVSCKTVEQKNRGTEKDIINALLDYYVRKYDDIYLSGKVIKIENPEVIFHDINIGEQIPSSCIEIMNDSIGLEPYPIKTSSSNYSYHVRNPRVFTNDKIEIKDSINIKNFKIEEQKLRSGKVEIHDNLQNDIAFQKYLYWNIENHTPVLVLSRPVIADNGLLAAVYVSRIKEGDFVWFLKKKKRKWEVFCEKRQSYH